MIRDYIVPGSRFEQVVTYRTVYVLLVCGRCGTHLYVNAESASRRCACGRICRPGTAAAFPSNVVPLRRAS